MSFANLRRVKEMLELTFPSFSSRTDKDERVERLLDAAHSKVRFKITKANGTMPIFQQRAAFAAIVASIVVSALDEEDRRLRFRVKDAVGFQSDPLTFTITGEVDGIQTTEDVLVDENGEFVSKTAWASIVSPIAVTNIPATPGQVQVLESVDPVLEQIEEWKVACLYLLESGDRFTKEAEAPEREDFCKFAKMALKEWIAETFKSETNPAPIYYRASS